MIAFDILDLTKARIERVIKVEFTGDSILLCKIHGSVQCFFNKSDSKDSGVTEYRKIGASPTDLANKAAEWVFNEFSPKNIFHSTDEKSILCSIAKWFGINL